MTVTAANEAPALAECRREIRRLHGCSARFERFVVVPGRRGRARRVIAVFELLGHPALSCFAWPEPLVTGGVTVVAVLRSIDILTPEDAVRYVMELDRSSQERWAQEYA